MAEPTVLHHPIPRRPFDLSTPSASSSRAASPGSPYGFNNSSQTDLKSNLRENSVSRTRSRSSSHVDLKSNAKDAPTGRTRSRNSSQSDLKSFFFRNSSQTDLKSNAKEDSISRTRSILNLTSSTLFGIYTPGEGPSSPGDTGAQTPLLRAHSEDNRPPVIGAFQRPPLQRSITRRQRNTFGNTVRKTIIPLALRTALLFLLGIAYGAIAIHLHDDRELAPAKIEGMDRFSRWYLPIWGTVGVLLGSLLPWVDTFWEETVGGSRYVGFLGMEAEERPSSATNDSEEDEEPTPLVKKDNGMGLTPAVRGIGAFVGIAFAIRKLPWESTSQLSLTLALVNPVLWYSVDRSKTGALVSTVVGIVGTAICLAVHLNMAPPPVTVHSPSMNATNSSYETDEVKSLVSTDSIGVGTWVASVLFCSSVCFGNIGRRLALGLGGGKM